MADISEQDAKTDSEIPDLFCQSWRLEWNIKVEIAWLWWNWS